VDRKEGTETSVNPRELIDKLFCLTIVARETIRARDSRALFFLAL
jgi:hypothetical protein